MKIIFLSDTHGYHRRVTIPEGDILIHGGDLSSQGREPEVRDFLTWLSSLPHKHKVFIAGNHDKSFDPKFNYKEPDQNLKPQWLQILLKSLPPNVHYLENTSIEIEGLKIWGSPISPWFHGEIWGFNKHRGNDIKQVWDTIPLDSDIVLTHSPVKGKCDLVERDQKHEGCEDLLVKLWEVEPILHLSGHLHTGYGIDNDEAVTFVNGSLLNDNYQLVNKPWVIEIEDKKIISVL